MWDSEQLRVEIRGFASGSVVANLAIIFSPSHSQQASKASAAVGRSLRNSSKYSVDPSSIHVAGRASCCLPGLQQTADSSQHWGFQLWIHGFHKRSLLNREIKKNKNPRCCSQEMFLSGLLCSVCFFSVCCVLAGFLRLSLAHHTVLTEQNHLLF